MADVIIVGAGAAGLTCARDLTEKGVECLVLEASDGVGGRVRSDRVDGFVIDRGFQILLTAYPQVKKRLDLGALGIGHFEPGAQVMREGRLRRVSDPLRRPLRLGETLATPIASTGDKLRAARLVVDVCSHSPRALLHRRDETTAARLARAGFSEGFIEAFWQPLFAGIQLDPELEVSSRRFEVILCMLARGSTGLPRDGIGAVSRQLGDGLPEESVRLETPVAAVQRGAVVTAGGERITARAVVVATDGPNAHGLLGSEVSDPGSRPVACCWYAARKPPVSGPYLLLDGGASGPAKNVVVMSEVAPSYAPPGRALIAAAVPGGEALDPQITSRVSEQLARWFGSDTGEWEHLRTDVIRHGQPNQCPPLDPRRKVNLGEGMFVCGDHRDTASLQGAMFSGERTAAAVLRHLHG
jgi:phytoene dehydrogenase-like protein